MGVTIKDVAKKVGVTPATVSMVINNKPRISEATRQRVLKAIAELDYFPHAGARNLVLRRTNVIGVAAPSFSSYFALETIGGIELELRESGFDLVLYNVREPKSEADDLVMRLARERRVDGLITVNLVLTKRQQDILTKQGTPLVSVEHRYDGFDSVQLDNKQGAYDATGHLIALGHRRIALINGADPTDLPAREREQGFLQALKDQKIDFNASLSARVDAYSQKEGMELAKRLMSLPQPPTAIFVAAGDVCASGVLLELRRSGLRVPEDVSVVGYDDQPFASLLDPPLTTVRQPMAQMGAKAVEILRLAIQQQAQHRPQLVSFQPTLEVRQSTAKVSKN